jgi:hypothetical protein
MLEVIGFTFEPELHLEGKRWVLVSTHGERERVRVEPFEALELDISRWWLETES